MAIHTKQHPTVLQWNCRSLKNNETPLLQYFLIQTFLPHLLLLQESRHCLIDPCYREINSHPSISFVFPYIRRDIKFQQIEAEYALQSYLVAIAYYSTSEAPVYLLNFYNPPKHQQHFLDFRPCDLTHPRLCYPYSGDINKLYTYWR